MTEGGQDKLELDYPCPWDYQVIGFDAEKIMRAVREVVGEAEHHMKISRGSRTGKYCSVHVEVIVENEPHRIGIFHELRTHADIIMVL